MRVNAGTGRIDERQLDEWEMNLWMQRKGQLGTGAAAT